MRNLRGRAWFIVLVCLAFAGARCGGCNNNANVGADGGPSDGGDGGPGDGGPNDGGPSGSFGPGDFALDGGPGGSGDGVQLNPDGGISLNSNDTRLHFAWIANNTAGTVSKFDTRTGQEVARYYTVVPRDGTGGTTGPVSTLRGNAANSPSRTAIDLYGDVWIANRANTSGLIGSVTKIANDLSSCRNQPNPRTSRDVNGDGVIDTSNPNEFIVPTDFANPATYDDCVLFSTPIGTTTNSSVKGRALAVSVPPLESGSSAGFIWVGHWAERTILKLDSSNGQVLGQIALGWGPYGAVVDSQQRLWVVAAPGDITAAKLALIDTKASSLANALINNSIVATGIGTTSDYGIAIDGKDRVWLAAWNSGSSAYRYDHGPGLDAGVGTWSRFDFTGAVSQLGNGFGDSRGIAADDQGIIWMSGHMCSGRNPSCGTSGNGVAQLIGFNAEDGGVKQFALADGGTVDFIDATEPASGNGTFDSIGVGPDSDNNLWVNNYSGNAMKVNRNTGAVFKTPNQGGSLYTYSDFTGYQLRHFTAPRGTYWRDFTGCGSTTNWLNVTWDATTPPRTAVQLYVKTGPSLASLTDTANPQYGPFTVSPSDLRVAPGPVPHNAYMRVLFVLTSQDRTSTPVLNSFNVTWSCPLL